MKRMKRYFSKGVVHLKRIVISSVLFVLPTKLSYLFLEVALTTFLLKTRDAKTTDVDMVRFFKLVKLDYNESIVDLPYYSIGYIWPSEYLDKRNANKLGKRTLREVVMSTDLLKRNIHNVVDSLLMNLPFLLRVKLGIHDDVKRKKLRKEVATFLERKLDLVQRNFKNMLGCKGETTYSS